MYLLCPKCDNENIWINPVEPLYACNNCRYEADAIVFKAEKGSKFRKYINNYGLKKKQ